MTTLRDKILAAVIECIVDDNGDTEPETITDFVMDEVKKHLIRNMDLE